MPVSWGRLRYIEVVFESSIDVLCPWFSHLNLPEFITNRIHERVHIEGQLHDPTKFDRLVI